MKGKELYEWQKSIPEEAPARLLHPRVMFSSLLEANMFKSYNGPLCDQLNATEKLAEIIHETYGDCYLPTIMDKDWFPLFQGRIDYLLERQDFGDIIEQAMEWTRKSQILGEGYRSFLDSYGVKNLDWITILNRDYRDLFSNRMTGPLCFEVVLSVHTLEPL